MPLYPLPRNGHADMPLHVQLSEICKHRYPEVEKDFSGVSKAGENHSGLVLTKENLKGFLTESDEWANFGDMNADAENPRLFQTVLGILHAIGVHERRYPDIGIAYWCRNDVSEFGRNVHIKLVTVFLEKHMPA